MTYIEELRLTKEEERAVRKYNVKSDNGIATEKDVEESVCAVLNAMVRHAENEEVIKKRENTFKNLWKEVGEMFPEDKPLSDISYFAIGQLGPLCITLLEEMEQNLSIQALEKFEKVEGLLEHCITEYVGSDNAKEDPIGIPLEKAACAETPDDVFAIKKAALEHIQYAYKDKNKPLFDAIFILLNLSDFGLEKIKERTLLMVLNREKNT